MIHPIKSLHNLILKNFIKDALEHLPDLKQQGLNYLKAHSDEILETVKKAIISAVKGFIEKKRQEAKAKIVEFTTNPN